MIDNAPLFSELSSDQRALIADRLEIQAFGAGDLIYSQGQPATAMYFIGSGRVRLLAGDEAVVANLGRESLFADTDLLAGRNYSLTAEAATNCAIWTLSAADLADIVAQQPEIGRQLRAAAGLGEEQSAERHLRRLGLLSGLSSEQIGEVAEHLRLESFAAGVSIYQQGTAGEALYLLEEGQVSVQSGAPDTPCAEVFATVGAGEFFGEDALLTGEPHRADAVTLSDASIWVLEKADFEALALRYPSLPYNMARALTRRQYHMPQQSRPGVRVVPAAALVAAPAARAVTAVTPTGVALPVPAAKPVPSAPVTGAMTGLTRAADSASGWFGDRSTGAKVRLIAVIVLLVWLIGVAAPAAIITLLSNVDIPKASDSMARAGGITRRAVLVALAADLPVQTTPTYTPWPTETPIPTPTFTPTATPTETPIPTPTFTPTDTPVPPTPTPRPVQRVAQAEAPAAPQAAAAVAAAPAPTVKYRLAEMRRLTPCENKGNHHVFIKIVDMAGSPVDGVTLVQVPRDQMGNVLDKMVSGAKGPGLAEFVMWKFAEYAVFVTEDGMNPASTDIAQPLHSNFTDEAECPDGGGNTLFHNSFSVIFQKTS